MRALEDDDLDAALALWAATEQLGPIYREELDQLRAHDPGLVLVAVEAASGQPLGVVLGSFDGRRGWISRLAVAQSARRRGVGRQLVAEVEDRLAARGCRQVNLLTFADNRAGRAMWEALGYHGLDRVVLYSRALGDDDPSDDAARRTGSSGADAEPGC